MNNRSLICVCGAGTMGSGIAQVFARRGHPTVLYDVDREMLHRSQSAISADLQLLATKNKITPAEKAAVLAGIRFTSDIAECKADVIVEAVVEKAEVKIALLTKLAALNSEKTILTTNTSSLSVSSLARAIPRPERFAGMHFFNPAPLMRLVEVVQSESTSAETIATLTTLLNDAGKTSVVCRDSPGFIVNRVARPFYLEALRLTEENDIDFESIDRLAQATGFRMGPFKLMDLIGNDINYAVSCIVYKALGSPARLKPSSIQEKLVSEGQLGRKTGKGFYEYLQMNG